jgi:hypothetical protein
MGGYSANAANVNFAFDLALETAADLYELAGVVDEKHSAWVTEANKGTGGPAGSNAAGVWNGGHRDTFDHNLATAGTDAGNISSGLRELADLFASKWAEARGEQDRINWARWVQSEKDDDNYAEDAVEWVAGEDDYGEPPPNPETPSAPGYEATRDPIHPEFEHQGASV